VIKFVIDVVKVGNYFYFLNESPPPCWK